MRNCGATQQIRYDCLFRYGIESEEAFYDVEAKARANTINVGVENFLFRKRGFYWRRSSFVIMILLAKASHIEKMMVQVQCGQDSRLSPVRIFNKERVITYRWEKIIKIQYAVIYVEATFKVELDKSVGI